MYAIGDLVDGVMLAHRASEEGIAVAEIIAGHKAVHQLHGHSECHLYRSRSCCGGIDGKRSQGCSIDVMIGTCLIRGNARARCVGDTDGVVKVIGDKVSGRLVGYILPAQNASEMIGEGVLAITKRLLLKISRMPLMRIRPLPNRLKKPHYKRLERLFTYDV